MNNLASLRAQLDTQLRDTDHNVWSQTEKEQLIINAVARLYPTVVRHVIVEVPSVDNTPTYVLDNSIVNVFRVDLLDASDNMLAALPNGSWELWGDSPRTLHVSRRFATAGYTFRVHGYGRYDVSDNTIDDHLVPLVLARARAEAYRRMGSDRVQFENWLTHNQTQNISVNELLQLINEAQREAEFLERQSATIKKPVPARV